MKPNRMMRLIVILSLCLMADTSKHRKKQMDSKMQAPIIQKKINYDDNTMTYNDSSDIPDSDKLEMRPRKQPQKEQPKPINNQFIQEKLPEMIGFLDQIIQTQSMDQDQFVFFNKIIQFGQKVQTFKSFPQDLQNQLISLNQKINQIQYIIQNQQLIQQNQQLMQQSQQGMQQSMQQNNNQQNQQDSQQQDTQQQFQQLQQQYQQQQQQIQQISQQPSQQAEQTVQDTNQISNQVNEQLNKFMDSIKDEMMNQRDFLNGKVNGLGQKLTLIENSQKIFEQQQNSMLKQLLDLQQKNQVNQGVNDDKQKQQTGFQITSPLLLQQMQQFQLSQNQMNNKPQNQQQNVGAAKTYQQTQQQLDKYLFDTFRFKQKNKFKTQIANDNEQMNAENQLYKLSQQMLSVKDGKQQQTIKAQIDKLQLQVEKQKRDNDFQKLLDNIDTKQMTNVQIQKVFDRIQKIIRIFLSQQEMQEFKTLQVQYEQFAATQVDNKMIRDNICQQIEFFNRVFDERIQKID